MKASASTKDKKTGKGKDHAYDRPTIPIPMVADGSASEAEVSDEDLQFFSEHAAAATGFAQNLDLNGIQRCLALMHLLVSFHLFCIGARRKLYDCIS